MNRLNKIKRLTFTDIYGHFQRKDWKTFKSKDKKKKSLSEMTTGHHWHGFNVIYIWLPMATYSIDVRHNILMPLHHVCYEIWAPIIYLRARLGLYSISISSMYSLVWLYHKKKKYFVRIGHLRIILVKTFLFSNFRTLKPVSIWNEP